MKYPLEKLYETRKKTKPQLTAAVFDHYEKIKTYFLSLGVNLLEPAEKTLVNLKMSELFVLVCSDTKIRDMLFDWSDIDYRVENSLEFEVIQDYVNTAKKLHESLEDKRKSLLKKIKTLFSEYLKDLQKKIFDLRHNKIQVEEVNYSDFKPYVLDFLGEDVLVKNLLLLKDVDDLFERIKTDALIVKLKKQSIIEDNNGYIDIQDLEEKEALLYEHLRSEAFREFCKNEFKHTPKTTATSTQIEISPGMELGKEMNLNSSELVFINISLNNFSIDFDDIKNRYDGKTFTMLDGRKYVLEKISNVKVHPFVIKKKMLSGNFLKIKIPIFYRHAVFNLIKSQRTIKK